MNDPAPDAITHLKTIRALMERATVYRAISAPGALFAGIVTLVLCAWFWRVEPAARLSPQAFLWCWVGVLILVTLFNFWLLNRSAQQRGDAFASSGMKMALRAVLPPLASGFVMGFLTTAERGGGYADMAAFWILFYGLALLAMGSFAPRSLLILGGAFVISGLAAFFPWVRELSPGDWEAALLDMGVTFGALHLVYAGCVFAVRKAESGRT